MRQDEELGERDGVHLAEGEVLESSLPHEGDVQQLRGRGGGLGPAGSKTLFRFGDPDMILLKFSNIWVRWLLFTKKARSFLYKTNGSTLQTRLA